MRGKEGTILEFCCISADIIPLRRDLSATKASLLLPTFDSWPFSLRCVLQSSHLTTPFHSMVQLLIGRIKASLTFCFAGLGSVRTATKRAGGTVRNHGHSPGKRLGIKKFSGAHASIFLTQSMLKSFDRPSCNPRQHHRTPTRHAISSRPARMSSRAFFAPILDSFSSFVVLGWNRS